MHKLWKELKPRLRPTWPHIILIMLLVFVTLIFITLRFAQRVDVIKEEVRKYASEQLRVPQTDSVIFTPIYTEIVKSEPGTKPRIGLFGASTVYGTTVTEGENTTAGVLQAKQPDYQVFNLGLTGARLTETYAILSSVIDSTDYIVYEINYGIAVVGDQEREVAVYPQLVEKLGSFPFNEWASHFSYKEQEETESQFRKELERRLLNAWPLYRDRDLLSFDQLKTRTTKERLRGVYQRWADGQAGEQDSPPKLTTPYAEMTPKQQQAVNKHFQELYAWKRPFDREHSFNLYVMDQTLQLLKQKGKKVLFYTAPLNRELIDREHLLDWRQYDEVMQAYRELIESYHYELLEFNTDQIQLDHRYYHDPSHLLDEGSRQFGELLAKEIKQHLLP